MNLIRSINWMVTSKCNCRCKHCDIWKQRPAIEISSKAVKNVLGDPLIRESYKRYGHDFDISLGGGEPFLTKNLPEITREIEGAFPGSLKTISTNGLLQDRIINFIKLNISLNFKLNISIDGIGRAHDLIRGREGAFNKAIETIHRIKKVRPSQKIELKLTIMPQNYNQIIKVYKLADKLNCGFSFKPAENIKSYTNKISPLRFNFSKEQLCVIRNQAFFVSDEAYRKGDFKKAEFFKDIPFYLFGKNKPNLCSVLDNDVTIMPDGSCYSCLKMPSLGTLSKKRLTNIWHNRIRGMDRCHSCMLMCGVYKNYSVYNFKRKTANFETTARCNLSCSMCTQKEVRIEKKARHNRDMDAVKFKKLIDKYKDIVHVSFVGGEPFLNKHFFNMMDLLDKKSITYEITTNGTLLNEKIAERLKKFAGLKKINFSLDGPEKYHDAQRGRGVFKKCINAIKLTKDFLNLNISSVMKNDNLREIPKLSQQLIKLGIRNQKIIYGMSLDRDSRRLAKDMVPSIKIQGPVIKNPAESRDKIEALFSSLNFLEKKYNISIAFEPALMKNNLYDFLNGKMSDKKGIACNQLYNYRLDSQGRRITCEFIRDIFDVSQAHSYLQRGKFFPICRRCCKLKLKTSLNIKKCREIY